jgi:protoporphyrin/coproporphyrin ferrochelatase
LADTAVLLVNLGTPEAPEPKAVRRYLREFLSDPRVVELPRWVWLPILHAFVLRSRPKASALKYESIWTSEGSPLRVHTERQTKLLAGYWGSMKLSPVTFAHAMRYGEPGIVDTLRQLDKSGAKRILVVPLYPQYARSTTASVADEVERFSRRTKNAAAVRVVRHFHEHPGYILALEHLVREHWEKNGRPPKMLFSFHGIPQRSVDRGDPYAAECTRTAQLLAEALQLRPDEWQMTFQSRFGRARWLQPYTARTLRELGKSGVVRADVLCPGFVSDCLETLEEIGMEGKAEFLGAGGRSFHALPCLNERDEWIKALCTLVRAQLDNWRPAA